MYDVTVREDWRWNQAQVAGRIFSKKGVVHVHEHEMSGEIRNSPVLSVVEVEAEVEAEVKAEVKAKAKAKAEAKVQAGGD